MKNENDSGKTIGYKVARVTQTEKLFFYCSQAKGVC